MHMGMTTTAAARTIETAALFLFLFVAKVVPVPVAAAFVGVAAATATAAAAAMVALRMPLVPIPATTAARVFVSRPPILIAVTVAAGLIPVVSSRSFFTSFGGRAIGARCWRFRVCVSGCSLPCLFRTFLPLRPLPLLGLRSFPFRPIRPLPILRGGSLPFRPIRPLPILGFRPFRGRLLALRRRFRRCGWRSVHRGACISFCRFRFGGARLSAARGSLGLRLAFFLGSRLDCGLCLLWEGLRRPIFLALHFIFFGNSCFLLRRVILVKEDRHLFRRHKSGSW
jgi:hypothetical protein